MSIRILACIFTLLLSTTNILADVEHLMPVPYSVEKMPGYFQANEPVVLNDFTDSRYLLSLLDELGIEVSTMAENRIDVEIVDSVADGFDYELYGYGNEGYELIVKPDAILIKAVEPIGVIRAAQTLHQLAMEGNGKIPCVEIKDRPAFKLRGFMHDVGRSFISVEELKREIDLLSRFKINTFHWHLTDYTGWRLEIKAFPELTSDKGITRFPGKYYTQEDTREIVEYAAERGMTVIPEIDMPGHSRPFTNAMGHDMLSEEGISELKIILKEVCDVFDKSPYIHIGGDEISFDDSYLIDMIDFIHNDIGKKVVIWNRYNRPAKKVDPKKIPCDMTTNWGTAGTLSPGLPNIDMRYNYINHFDMFADLVGIYKSNIFYLEQGNPDVAGEISAVWNDTKVDGEEEIVRMNNLYANVLASGERAWRGGGKQYIEDGGTTLPSTGEEYEDFADWERRFLYHKENTLKDVAYQIPYVKQTNVKWMITDQIPNKGDKDARFEPEDYIGKDIMPSEYIINGDTINSHEAVGAGIYLRHIWHDIVKGFYDNPQDSVTSYAWTYVYSPEEQDVGALIEFYCYSRSGSDVGPIDGEWDRRGSKIWLNGEEILAPEWEQPYADILQDHDIIGLTNENFTNREPVSLHLKRGWNQVFMKLPHVDSGGTFRDKWMFTFVITDKGGRDALDGLIYSPDKNFQ